MQECGFILEFLLENARGFQGIFDILLILLRRKKFIIKWLCPNPQNLITIYLEVFTSLIKARVRKTLVIWDQGPELLLGVS